MERKGDRQAKKQTLNYRVQTDDYKRGRGWGEMDARGDRDERGHLS